MSLFRRTRTADDTPATPAVADLVDLVTLELTRRAHEAIAEAQALRAEVLSGDD